MQPAKEKQKRVIQDDVGAVLEWYRRILTHNPKNIQARYKLSWLLQKLGHPEEALAQWQEVLKIDANNLIAREAILKLADQVREKKRQVERPPTRDSN